MKRSKPWQGGHSALLNHGPRYGSHFPSVSTSPRCSDKTNSTFVEVEVCCISLVLVKRFLQLMNQLTCSMERRTGNYFGTCKCKKGQEGEREENTGHFLVRQKVFIPLHQGNTHCPLVNSTQNTEPAPRTSFLHLIQIDFMLLLRLIPGRGLKSIWLWQAWYRSKQVFQ